MLGITQLSSVLSHQKQASKNAFLSSFAAFRSYSTGVEGTKQSKSEIVPPNLKKDDSRKTYLINRYKTLLQDTPIVLFAHHNNLVKTDENTFRNQIREVGGEFTVIRNNLLLAYLKAENEKYPSSAEAYKKTRFLDHPLKPFLVGPTAMITVQENNPQVVSKILKTLKTANEKLFVVGARIENRVFDLPQVNNFKDLPSKEQLHSELAGMLTVLSGAGLVQTLQSASQHLYLTLESHRKNNDPSEKKEDEPEAS